MHLQPRDLVPPHLNVLDAEAVESSVVEDANTRVIDVEEVEGHGAGPLVEDRHQQREVDRRALDGKLILDVEGTQAGSI